MDDLTEFMSKVKREYRAVMDDCLCKLDDLDKKYGTFGYVDIEETEVTACGDAHKMFMRRAEIEFRFDA